MGIRCMRRRALGKSALGSACVAAVGTLSTAIRPSRSCAHLKRSNGNANYGRAPLTVGQRVLLSHLACMNYATLARMPV